MTDPITATIRGYLAAAEPMCSGEYLDGMAGGISAALLPLIPDAPQPATTDDTIERAALVGQALAETIPDGAVDDETLDRVKAAVLAALAAAGAGAEVDRDRKHACCKHCVEDPGYHAENPPHSHDVRCDQCGDYAEGYAAGLAARGDAATPTEVETVTEQEETRKADGDVSLWRRTVTYGPWREVTP